MAHGRVREDPYYWLRERDDPEVLAYLEEENAYTERAMAHTGTLQEELFAEIKGRLKPDDASAPYRRDGAFYYERFEKGKEYAIHCRRRGSLEAPEEVLLDGNALGSGHEYFALRLAALGPDHRIVAFATDTVGRRVYTVRFRDTETGTMLDDALADVTGNAAFANDGVSVFYTKQHPETLRSYRLYHHRLGTDASEDTLLYQEDDETFHIHVFKTKSKRFLFLVSERNTASEVRYLDADAPEGEFRILQEREPGHEYEASHLGEHFYVLTNLDATNFRLVRAPLSSPGREHWEEIVPHRDDVLLEDFELFRDHLVLVERREGLRRLRVRRWDGSDDHHVAFDDPAYVCYPTRNYEVETSLLRFGYTSLTTPRSTYDYDMNRRERRLLKRDEVLGGFDPSRYRSERLRVPAPDGARVPVSVVYRRDTELEGRAPLLLHGYGAYGINAEPTFSEARLSLLDRGFVYAIAHVRGGEEMGRPWYEAGKLLKKKNTFSDFVACAEHLIARGYADRNRLYAQGGSAGGLLIGAVLNERGDLFHGAVAHVPFVDVVTTMLDPSIPLTTSEYDEWGDAADPKFHDYILSYSPYDNVGAKPYPNLLVTAGIHDSQVQYWEPAKWVAKLRAMKTDDHLLLLHMHMGAGHHGPSGRYRRHRETALTYAFLLDLSRSVSKSQSESRSTG